MRLSAPAKINLHLRVGPPRSDGFHPLLTWMVTVGLFDTLVFMRRREAHAITALTDRAQPIADSTSPALANASFSLSTDHPSLPTDGRNLVVRVATALADALLQSRSGSGEGSPATKEEVSAFLAKRIPAGAGLGGGSSDAAFTLMALNRFWKIGWSNEELARIAERFGSDLSFFFYGPSSICTGRGEVVRPVAAPSHLWATLVLPKIEMPTPAVYRRFDELGLGREDALRADLIRDEAGMWVAASKWARLSAGELMPFLVNDLEPAAFSICPELGELRATLERSFSQIVRMSGSGSSLFTLCDDADEAQSLAQQAQTSAKVRAIAVPIAPQLADVSPSV